MMAAIAARPAPKAIESSAPPAPVERTDGAQDAAAVTGEETEVNEDFSSTLADEQSQGDGTRAAQDMLAQGSVVQLFPVRIAPAEAAPGLEKMGGTPLEQAVQTLLDQMQSAVAAAAPTLVPTAEQSEQALQVADMIPSIDTVALDDLDDQSEDEAAAELGAMFDALPPAEGPKHTPEAPATSKGPVATTAVHEPEPLPENENPSHMHLVVDDGDQRVVVTVAVRGEEVRATVRGGDEQLAASLTRNAASLDTSMKAQGLDLQNFSAERDLAREQHRSKEQPQERDEAPTEKFSLEEVA